MIAILLLLTGCTADPDPTGTTPAGTSLLDLPIDAPGPYNAGFRAWDVTYAPYPGQSRTITLNAWYPTEDTTGGDVVYAGLQPDPLALGDATPIAAPAGGFPLHAHSHGHQGFGGTSAFLMRFFASHGWVGVAPDHVGNLLSDDPSLEVPEFDALRPMDVIAVVDALAALPADDPLSAAITERYLLSGHSRGCTTDWSVLGATFDPANPDAYCPGCAPDLLAAFTDGSVVDPRVAAAIPMAGSYGVDTFGEDGWQAVDAPILSLTGSADNPDGAREQFDRITGKDFTWVELEGGCHQTFALGVCDTLDVDDGFFLVDTYAIAFARAHLLGDTDPDVLGLLDGTIALDPRATLSKN